MGCRRRRLTGGEHRGYGLRMVSDTLLRRPLKRISLAALASASPKPIVRRRGRAKHIAFLSKSGRTKWFRKDASSHAGFL